MNSKQPRRSKISGLWSQIKHSRKKPKSGTSAVTMKDLKDMLMEIRTKPSIDSKMRTTDIKFEPSPYINHK